MNYLQQSQWVWHLPLDGSAFPDFPRYLFLNIWILSMQQFAFILDLVAGAISPMPSATTCDLLVCAQWPITVIGLNWESIFVIKCWLIVQFCVFLFFTPFIISKQTHCEIIIMIRAIWKAPKCICAHKIRSAADFQRLESCRSAAFLTSSVFFSSYWVTLFLWENKLLYSSLQHREPTAKISFVFNTDLLEIWQ